MKKYILLLVSLVSVSLYAEPVKFTNQQADEVLGALLQLPPGLSGANISRAARATLALRPIVEAFSKGLEQERIKFGIVPGVTRTDSPEYIKFTSAREKYSGDTVTVDLTRFTLTDEELERSKPAPSVVATLLLYLEPKTESKK